ncbi:MAG TPA: amidohydrolase family protein [Gemmatimonadaceae bacterium]|nr:amidohydrolase family protein [Gemmatimonadaceae bacterium]
MIRYHAAWVLPIATPPVPQGTVAVADGRIAYVGPRHGAPPGTDVDLGDAVLMPGLVNAHTHLELTSMRGFLEDLDFRSWILRLTRARQDVLTPDMLVDAARYGIAEGLAAGVTTYADTCESGAAFDAMLEGRVRGIVYQEVFGPAPVACDEALAGLKLRVQAMQARQTPLVRVGVSPHAPYTVSDRLFAATARYAIQARLPIAIHVAESDAEQRLVAAAQGEFADALIKRGIRVEPRARSPIQLLRGLRVLDAQPLLIHCVHADATDVHAIAASGCTVAHCPASNAKLGHGVAPLTDFLNAGIAVGLGSDSMASNNRMSILSEAWLATLQQRARNRRPDAVTAARALRLATIDGARALRIDDEVGSLERGKAADLAAFPIDQRLGPMHDIETKVVFALNGVPASFVMVAGQVLVRDGAVMNADPGLPGRVQHAADLLQQWLAGRE